MLRDQGGRLVPPNELVSVVSHDVASTIHQSLPAPTAAAVATTVQRVVMNMLMTALVSTMPQFRGVHSSTFQLLVSTFGELRCIRRSGGRGNQIPSPNSMSCRPCIGTEWNFTPPLDVHKYHCLKRFRYC